MKSTTHSTLLVCLALLAPIGSATAEALDPDTAYRLVGDMFSAEAKVRKKARKALIKADDPTIAPALVDSIFFNRNGRTDTVAVLKELLDASHGTDYKAWIEEIGRRDDISPKPGYLNFKATQFGRIDPNFVDFLDPAHERTIRPEEIVWGGVKKDGIPALRNPKKIPAAEADYLKDRDQVFGVTIAGESVAYPLRILDWHEMFNDVVGKTAITLSYCTLCGSGVLYNGTLAEGETYTFGSSGLLYRSNKLMYDHQTKSLWSNLTGEPVFGPLVGKGKVLDILPVVVTTWEEWRGRHPDTLVLSLDTGYRRDYSAGAAYGAYFRSKDLMFPVWQQDTSKLRLKDWVFTLEHDGQRKAYPIDVLKKTPIVNDRIGDLGVVLITDPKSEAVRAYSRGDRDLEAAADGLIVDRASGERFEMKEEALVSESNSDSSEPIRLERLGGHRAFWFGLYTFHPGIEVYEPEE